MYGLILNNRAIKKLVSDSSAFQIDPFSEDRLRTIHYPLRAARFERVSGETRKLLHDFDYDGETFLLEPEQYVVAAVHEKIALPFGVIGHFIPSSNTIDMGIGITAGRIEYPWGQNNERLRFGIKNLTDKTIEITQEHYLCYVYFIDLRELKSDNFELGSRDLALFELWKKRHEYAKDDGVIYDEEGGE